MSIRNLMGHFVELFASFLLLLAVVLLLIACARASSHQMGQFFELLVPFILPMLAVAATIGFVLWF